MDRPRDQDQDPGALWDALVVRSLARASTTPSEPDRRGQRVRLRVHPELTPAARPDVRREIAPWVPAPLRLVVRGLVAGERPWPLYLYGASGVGKTSLALLMLDACGPKPSDNGHTPERVREWLCGYADVRWIAGLKVDADKGRLFWSSEGHGSEFTWDRLAAAVRRAPLFVFDEIGVGAVAGDFRLDTVLEVIGARCVNPVRPFVVTGNVDPEQLVQIYDNRVSRRVTWGTVVRWDRDGVGVWERDRDGSFVRADPE